MSANVAASRAAAARNELPFLRHRARPAPTAVRSAPRTVSPVAGPIPVKDIAQPETTDGHAEPASERYRPAYLRGGSFQRGR